MTAVMALESDEILRMDSDKRDFPFREDEQRSWGDCMANARIRVEIALLTAQ